MRILSAGKHGFLFLAITCFFALPATHIVCAQTKAASQTKVLAPEDIRQLMPATVFFRGQSASVQLRNTFGLRFPDGALVLAGLVDSSGYSSGIKQKYQGYLLSEVELTVNGKTLPAGAYGFGFLANHDFVVMNLGAHDVLRSASMDDSTMNRPRPLMITPGKRPGVFRLYSGRRFVSIGRK